MRITDELLTRQLAVRTTCLLDNQVFDNTDWYQNSYILEIEFANVDKNNGSHVRLDYLTVSTSKQRGGISLSRNNTSTRTISLLVVTYWVLRKFPHIYSNVSMCFKGWIFLGNKTMPLAEDLYKFVYFVRAKTMYQTNCNNLPETVRFCT